MIFFNEKKIEKDSDNFWYRKLTLKVGRLGDFALFDTFPLVQFSKFKNFLWVCLFLGKNLSNFVPPAWKLDNPFYHTCPGIFVIRPIETFVVTKVELLSNIICVRICGNYYCTITSFVKSSLKLNRSKTVFLCFKAKSNLKSFDENVWYCRRGNVSCFSVTVIIIIIMIPAMFNF